MLTIGLMSGTSLDGVDAALVELTGDSVDTLRWKLIGAVTTPYGAERREKILRAIEVGRAPELSALNVEIGEWLADAAMAVCAATGTSLSAVDVIGSHGQTFWHQPPVGGARGSTLQLGCAATIAERTGVAVVSDFRSRDVAAGGHGAPLVPWVDRAVFSVPDRTRALQNIGGIGNVTRVPPRGSAERILAFDTGPGNALIDSAVMLATDGRLAFDRDGLLAARGNVDETLVEELLQHPYFDLAPPKSTGRELFGQALVTRLVEALRPEGDQDWLDLVATLTELTARSIARSYERWLIPLGLDEIVVTGGGALNPVLVARITQLVSPVPVIDCREMGIDPGEKEALAFAILAWAHLHGIPANEPAATGASGPRVLGSLTPGARPAR
ncbi:MAG: anhydro-N-acetylmuramic acid kinase [Gemmatimonadota bacterium]|nr:anhydro-N-acetylmuramic acid kinase [Gemmatimonadota bacterium]